MTHRFLTTLDWVRSEEAIPYIPIQAKLQCTVCFDKCLSYTTWTFSAVFWEKKRLASNCSQRAWSAHGTVTSSLVFIPWSPFDNYKALHTRVTPKDLLIWRCSDPFIPPSQFGQSKSLRAHFFCFQVIISTKESNKSNSLTGANFNIIISIINFTCHYF